MGGAPKTTKNGTKTVLTHGHLVKTCYMPGGTARDTPAQPGSLSSDGLLHRDYSPNLMESEKESPGTPLVMTRRYMEHFTGSKFEGLSKALGSNRGNTAIVRQVD